MPHRMFLAAAVILPLPVPSLAGQIEELVESVEAYAATHATRQTADPEAKQVAAETDPDCIRPAPGDSAGLIWSSETSRCGSRPAASDPLF